ncbi:MAG: hypothetical protein K2K26_07920, partial [Muribaculaceae bacterium]|nr:hypothetical protein [Muribaculaceae bacterium]
MKRYGVLLIPLVYCVLWLLAAGCGGGVRHDSRLTEIERLSEEHSDTVAATAVSRLELIDRSALSGSDRRYYDFLRVKTADKAYITHTSDSLILSVIDYAASHRRELSYPEALYYGGRVYSDLGDYPTALRYFQQALDEMPKSGDSENSDLRRRVLSQTGRLLNTLRLYNEAVPYIEEAIELGGAVNDSISMMQNIQLLGSVYLRAEKYDTAEIKFRTAYNIAEKVSPVDCYTQQMYFGAIKYYKGEVDSALAILRPVVRNIYPDIKDYALAYAANVYLKAGILDTAFMYAKELIWDKNSNNRATGYQIATSPGVINLIPKDSLPIYLAGHRDAMEESLERNGPQQALMQQSLYNYRLHERERVKAESSRDRLRLWLVVIVLSVMLVFSLLVGVIIYQKARNRKDMLRLHDALDSVEALRRAIEPNEPVISNSDRSEAGITVNETNRNETVLTEIDSPMSESERLQLLKTQLKDELLALVRDSSRSASISPDIVSSEVYSRLEAYALKGEVIPNSSPLWEQLEQTVLASSNKFRYRLQLLTGSPLKTGDYRMVLLLKCGMSPTQLTTLLGRAKGTIGYKREALSLKMFGEKLDMKVIDSIIR